jgi:5-oxoprolinase (ATP-hydrolysing) subunit A
VAETRVLDLNADLGEGSGTDAVLCRIVTTVNLAAGGHAGGAETLTRAVAAAVDEGVSLGAHPSYPDRTNFGRISLLDSAPAGSFFTSITEQILAVARAAQAHRRTLNHVKPHGALYNDAAVRVDAAHLVIEAVLAASAELPTAGTTLALMGMPGTLLQQMARDTGVPFIAEGFADRAYLPDGTLAPRSAAGAVLTDRDAVISQARQLALHGTVTATDGIVIAMPVQTLCIHGDTPGASDLAQAIRSDLEAHGVHITAITGRA